MPIRVQLPNGQTAQFPDGMSTSDIQNAIEADPQFSPPPSTGQKIATGLENFGKGVLEGAGNTLNVGEDWAAKHLPPWFTTPIGQKPTPENSSASVARYHQLITPDPNSPGQKIGKGVEQAAEFLLPTGVEEGAARLGGEALGRGGDIAGHLLGSAGHSALINKAQGGSATTGALVGAGTSAIGQAAKAAAPVVTEIAQGIHTPAAQTGKAILDETSGILPTSVRRSAKGILKGLNPELNRMADESPAMISMQPARTEAGKQIVAAQTQNVPKLVKGVKNMANQLVERTYEPLLGAEGPSATLPIPDEVPARQYLELRRGVGKALPAGSWSPESSNAFKPARDAVYGTMTDQFHEAVPGTDELDSRIHDLIPATKKPKNFFFGHALGPGVGATLGGVGGYRRGIGPEGTDIMGGLKEGTLGALGGATAGFVYPAALNAGARVAFSPTAQRLLVPATSGALLQTPGAQ